MPSPAASRGRMGSLIARSSEFEQGRRQQQAAARSLRHLCHHPGSLSRGPDGPGQNRERPAWLLRTFQMGSQPDSFTLTY